MNNIHFTASPLESKREREKKAALLAPFQALVKQEREAKELHRNSNTHTKIGEYKRENAIEEEEKNRRSRPQKMKEAKKLLHISRVARKSEMK